MMGEIMYNVIIIEDDPMVAAINRQYLQFSPMFCVTGEFRNGKDALDYVASHSVDLAIVDYYMPILDGHKFLAACHERHIRLDVIMITAANSTEELKSILQYGVIDYLVKPFTYERFQQAIQKYIKYKDVFDSNDHLSQNEIDRIMASGSEHSENYLLDKGMQLQTLNVIRNYLAQHDDIYLGSNEIAGEVNLSRITVRRYMNFLLEKGEIISRVDYATGGRPSIKYKKC
jgi:CitB family two-component system response regulator MalR/two-component system response regulator DctR